MQRIISYAISLTVLIAITSACSSIKKAKERGDKFEKQLNDIRMQVYQSVKDIKNHKDIESKKVDDLKKQYKEVQSSFNDNYDKIIAKMDSSILDQSKCVLLNYKVVVSPYEEDFQKSGKLATAFNQSALKAQGAAAIGISDIAKLILEILKEIAKNKIKMCKDDINAMKYKSWDEI